MIVNQNLARMGLPDRYQLLALDLPDEMAFHAIGEADLPPDWRQDREATRTLGNRWLGLGETSLARVPSALVPRTFNWLLNPLHDDARLIVISETIRADFDARLAR